jgi:hypothetical protein
MAAKIWGTVWLVVVCCIGMRYTPEVGALAVMACAMALSFLKDKSVVVCHGNSIHERLYQRKEIMPPKIPPLRTVLHISYIPYKIVLKITLKKV